MALNSESQKKPKKAREHDPAPRCISEYLIREIGLFVIFFFLCVQDSTSRSCCRHPWRQSFLYTNMYELPSRSLAGEQSTAYVIL